MVAFVLISILTGIYARILFATERYVYTYVSLEN